MNKERKEWLISSKENYLCNIKDKGEAASADDETVTSYREDLSEIVNEGDYTNPKLQCTYWKKMLSSIFIAMENKSRSSCGSSENKLVFLLEVNIASDF